MRSTQLLPDQGKAGELLVTLAEPLFGGERTGGDIATGGFGGLCDLTTVLVRPGDQRIARSLCKGLVAAEHAAEQGRDERQLRSLESFQP